MPIRIPVFPQHPVWLLCPAGHQQTWECVVYCLWPGTMLIINWDLRCRAGDDIKRVTPPGTSVQCLLIALDMDDREMGPSTYKQYKNCFFISEYGHSHKLRENTTDPRNSTGFLNNCRQTLVQISKQVPISKKAGGEGDDRGWDGWMASLTQWTWVWASYRRWWWTGKPGVLQSMGSCWIWLGNWTTTHKETDILEM